MVLPEPIQNSNASLIPQDQTCERLKFAEIELATHGFDEDLLIGHDDLRQGKVYKSMNKWRLGNEVAFNRMACTSDQGANEFEVEVKLISNLRHRNLVRLIGYCSKGEERILAYELMPNGTLEDHLHKGHTKLSWLQRLIICIGAARGLDYMHTGGMPSQHDELIHRDVKPRNISLDSNFSAKICGFGLAKVGTGYQTQTSVGTSTPPKGTSGYIDPWYEQSGELTGKSDVYAFGVVLFEVLSEKKVVDQTLVKYRSSLTYWAQALVNKGRLNKIISNRLMGQISKKCLKEFTSIAVQCIRKEPRERPTMAEVVVKLESILSQERKSAGSGVDNGRLFDKLKYIFKGKAAHIPEGSISEYSAEVLNRPSVRTFTHDVFVRATKGYSNIFWVDELTYDPTEPGVGLAMWFKQRRIETSELNFNPEDLDFNHPCVIKLLGYCFHDDVLSYVYKRIICKNLAQLLYNGTTSLSWVARLKIAVQAAQGLSFLHKKGQPLYTQFDTNCILVDKNYNARLWNYELDYSVVAYNSFPYNGHYAAPEWFRYKADVKLEGVRPGYEEIEDTCFGVKSEVYSFGVVLLEILTGMEVFDSNRPQGQQNLVKWATPLLADEVSLGRILDPQLKTDDNPPKGAFVLAQLVSNCLLPTQDKRPSMEEIVEVLWECYIDQFDS